jgi:hypothetical protein
MCSLEKDLQKRFWSTFAKYNFILVSQINQQIADAPLNKRNLKYLSLVGYQSLKQFWAFRSGLRPSTI